jgi:hypothetical protein
MQELFHNLNRHFYPMLIDVAHFFDLLGLFWLIVIHIPQYPIYKESGVSDLLDLVFRHRQNGIPGLLILFQGERSENSHRVQNVQRNFSYLPIAILGQWVE